MPLDLESPFSILDWAIVAVYISLTILIGIWANKAIRNMADYLVAGRSLQSFLSVATMVGSELGLVTVMYAAQKGFTGGFAAFHIGLTAGVVTLIVGLTGFIVVPLREMGVMTIPEFYQRRYGKGVRVLGGLLLALAGILNMGLFLRAGAIFVTGLTGLENEMAVNLVMTALILLVLLYTILGGMVSVVLTDYMQFVVLSFGMLLACGLALGEVGWSELVEGVKTIHGEAGFDPFHGDGFGPSYIVWQLFIAGLVSCAVWQTAVMRACAAENTRVVKKLYMLSSIGFMIRFLIPQFLGICALVYFCRDPAVRELFFPAEAPAPGSPEQLALADATMRAMPQFLSQILPVGIIGIIGAGMLAAFMSTHDSYLLCWASVLAEDVIHPLLPRQLEMRHRLLLSRVLIFVIGIFLLVWSLWFPLGQDLWDYMAITGAIYFTGALPLLIFGLYWKRASRTGAYAALACGLIAILGVDVFGNFVIEVLTPFEGLLKTVDLSPGTVTSVHIGLFAITLAAISFVTLSILVPDRSPKAEASHE